MNQIARVILNTLSSYARVAVSFVVSLLLVPFIIRHLGTENFGLWSLIFSVVGFFGLLDLGLATAVVKYVAHCRGQDDIQQRNEIVSTVALVYLALAVLASAFVAILAWRFNVLFQIPIHQHQDSIWVFWIIAVRSVLLNLPLSVFRGVLFGEQRIYLINAIGVLSNLFYGFAAWWILSSGYGIVTLAWVNLIAMLLEHLCYLAAAFIWTPGFELRWNLVQVHRLKELSSFSAYQFLADMASVILLQMDLIIVQAFMSLTEVAVYAVALRVSTQIYYLAKQFVNVLSPLIAENHGQGNTEAVRLVLLKGSSFAMVPGVIFTVSSWVFATEALSFWVNPSILAAAPILTCLLCSLALGLPGLVASNVLAMTGRHRLSSICAMASVLVNAVASIICIQFWGLLGVAIGTLIARILVDLAFLLVKACRLYQLDLGTYIRLAVIPPLLPAIFQYAVLQGFKEMLPPTNLFWLLVDGALASGVYLAVYWRYCLDPSSRQVITQLMRRK